MPYTNPVVGDGLNVQDPVVLWFDDFYKTSDSRDAHGLYVDNFAPDATLVMGANTAVGHDAILRVRTGMWQAVAKRRHVVHQIYKFGRGTDEYMLTGTVSYEANNGTASSKDWAAHAVLTQQDGAYKFARYHVYM